MVRNAWQGLARDTRVIVISVIASSLIVGVPATAAIVATNSDKVDGKHAVAAKATKAKRARKLVATNKSGVLPNNIIVKAPDADRLDGKDSRDFLATAHLVRSGGGRSSGVNVMGCGDSTPITVPVTLARPSRIDVHARSWVLNGTGLSSTLTVRLRDGGDTVVASSTREQSLSAVASKIGVGGLLYAMTVDRTPYTAPAGSYTLELFAKNFGLCDDTRVTIYNENELTYLAIPVG